MVKENQDNLLFSVEEFKANREVKIPSNELQFDIISKVNSVFLLIDERINPQSFLTLLSN